MLMGNMKLPDSLFLLHCNQCCQHCVNKTITAKRWNLAIKEKGQISIKRILPSEYQAIFVAFTPEISSKHKMVNGFSF